MASFPQKKKNQYEALTIMKDRRKYIYNKIICILMHKYSITFLENTDSLGIQLEMQTDPGVLF